MSQITQRKTLATLAALMCLAGCDALQPPAAAPEADSPGGVIDESSRAEGRKQFALFLQEADKAVTLLESHPAPDALRDASGKLHERLGRASDADSSDKMDELVEEGRTALRYFDAGLKVANYQARRKDVTPEAAKRFIDKTCDGNAPAFRQLIGMLKAKFASQDTGAFDPPGKSSAGTVQNTRGTSGG